MTGLTDRYWETRSGGTTLQVYPDMLSLFLVDQGGPKVNQLARTGAHIAQVAVRDAGGERFIGYKSDVESPVGASGFHLRSGRIPELSQALSIPVAIITNDSNRAFEQEVGSADGGIPASRPLLTAYQRLRAFPGVKGIRTLIRNSPVGSFRKDADNVTRRRIKAKP